MYGIYALDEAHCVISPEKLLKENIKADEKSSSKCSILASRAAKRGDVCYATYPKYVQDLDPHGKLPKLNMEQMMACILHIWEALAFLHEHKIIHGDIKGPNMALIMRAGKPLFVFADWGWSAKTNTLAEARDALESMQSVAREYIANYYNASSNGIWSPKILDTPLTLKGIRSLLEFNDVFGLAYDLMDFVKRCERHGLLSPDIASKLEELFKKIFYKQPKTMRASKVVDAIRAIYA